MTCCPLCPNRSVAVGLSHHRAVCRVGHVCLHWSSNWPIHPANRQAFGLASRRVNTRGPEIPGLRRMNSRRLPINSIGPFIRTCQIASGAEIFLCAHSMTLGIPLGRPVPVARRVVAWCVSQRRTPSRWSWHPDERWKLVNPEGGLRFTSDQGVQPEVGSIHTI